jgi:hypothetical protein
VPSVWGRRRQDTACDVEIGDKPMIAPIDPVDQKLEKALQE